jgi:quercetin dioxygenase-like cupin family protein
MARAFEMAELTSFPTQTTLPTAKVYRTTAETEGLNAIAISYEIQSPAILALSRAQVQNTARGSRWPILKGTKTMKIFLAAAIGLAVTATNAFAGECPVDQVLTTPREIENAPDVGVERPVLHEVDLTGWRGMGSFHLRMRRLTVAVDGIVPTHAHDDRPSIVLIQTGEIIEHSAFCAVPILHKEGESTPEFGPGHKHWWENKSGKVVVLISTDVVPVEMKDEPMMQMP